MSSKTPVSPEEFAQSFESLAPATDRARLAGLDHARRVQAGRVGATRRRLALTHARRGDDQGAITALESRLETEQRVDAGYQRAVTRAEIQVPERRSMGAVLHGLVFAPDGTPAQGLTVAAVEPKGAVARFTCTDAKGYFRMDLEAGDGNPGPVFLQVSDADQAVLYRGDEAIALESGGITYREIRLGGERLPPCPMPPDRATMPRLLDLPESEALALLGRFGLDVAQRMTQNAPQRAGLVVSQEPAAGTPIGEDTRVTLVIGVVDGGSLVTVPDVTRVTLDEATSRLEEAGLPLGQVAEVPGEPRGQVRGQDPKAGTRVQPGTPVNLNVAAGAADPRIQVPDVVGREAEEAVKVLQESGLESGRVSFRDGEPPGIVVEQEPRAGQRVSEGTGVDLVVGRERTTERIDTPDVVGRSLAGAAEILEAARLKMGDVSGGRDGVVAEQKPAAGEAIPAGSAVSLRLERQVVTPGRPTRPVEPTRPVVRGRTTYADTLATRIAADPDFGNLEISRQQVSTSLEEANVTDAGSARRVIDMDNATLARTFGIDNLNHARSLRRMLREAVEQDEE